MGGVVAPRAAALMTRKVPNSLRLTRGTVVAMVLMWPRHVIRTRAEEAI
jgi:hypothetical protein